MGRSKILDRGEARITLYPEVTVVNRRGETYRVPSEEGVTVRATISEERQSTAELAGQVEGKVIRVVCRYVEGVGAETRVVFRGEEWDLAEPPHISLGASKRMRHLELLLRSRNKLDQTRV